MRVCEWKVFRVDEMRGILESGYPADAVHNTTNRSQQSFAKKEENKLTTDKASLGRHPGVNPQTAEGAPNPRSATPGVTRDRTRPHLRLLHVFGIGLARWLDIPLHGGEAQEDFLVPVSDVDERNVASDTRLVRRRYQGTNETVHPEET